MFKAVFSIFRGGVAAAGEEPEDWTALLILDQQMRDADAAVDRSKRTLALVTAGDPRLEANDARIAHFEVRARTLFASEITRLRRHVANAEARITELDRGRLARLKAKRTAAGVKLNPDQPSRLVSSRRIP